MYSQYIDNLDFTMYYHHYYHYKIGSHKYKRFAPLKRIGLLKYLDNLKVKRLSNEKTSSEIRAQKTLKILFFLPQKRIISLYFFTVHHFTK